jgi:hypothetical protein
MENSDSVREKSDKKVKRLANKTGGHVVPNSGATFFRKGDLSYSDSLVEHKFTEKNSFKLDRLVLVKIYKEALMVGKEPIIFIDFGDYQLVGHVQKNKL